MTASRTASARDARSSCPRAAPRADSIAVSPSRWLASSRAARTAPAVASSSSCSEPMSSSDRDTTRLLASAARICGSPVDTWRPPRPGRLRHEETTAASRWASEPAWRAGMAAVSTVMSQEAALTPRPCGPRMDWPASAGP